MRNYGIFLVLRRKTGDGRVSYYDDTGRGTGVGAWRLAFAGERDA